MVYYEVYETLSLIDLHLIAIAMRYYSGETVDTKGTNDALGIWDRNPNARIGDPEVQCLVTIEIICNHLQERRSMLGDYWRTVFRAIQAAIKQYELYGTGPIRGDEFYEQAQIIYNNLRLYMPWLIEECSFI